MSLVNIPLRLEKFDALLLCSLLQKAKTRAFLSSAVQICLCENLATHHGLKPQLGISAGQSKFVNCGEELQKWKGHIFHREDDRKIKKDFRTGIVAKAMETSPDVEERMKEVLAARLDHEIKVILDGTVK